MSDSDHVHDLNHTDIVKRGGSFPQVKVERDNGGVLRRVISEDLILPNEINSENVFNWLTKTQERRERYFGIEKHTQLSAKGTPITERINVFGVYTMINNYDPETGRYIGSLLEVEDD